MIVRRSLPPCGSGAKSRLVRRQPLVSVVMPVYDAAETIEEAVRSLLAQTYERLEILVVDDGSVDASMTIVAGIEDSRIKVLRQGHQGLVNALNNGCAQAQGGYIARLDADDVAHEGRIGAQVAYLEEHPGVGLLGTWARFRGEDGLEWNFEPPVSDPALRRYLLWDSPYVHSSVMFRRKAFQDTGGYPKGANEDYRLWIRMAKSWELAVLPQVLVTHRVRRTSLSHGMHRPAAMLARLNAQWEAARMLGPWHQAVLALGVTGGAYLLALVGGRLETTVRRLVRGISARFRGFRDVSSRDRPG